MSQTIFLPSGKYVLEFYYQVDGGGSGTRLFASIGGQQVFSEVDQAAHGYIRATVNFTRNSSGNAELLFEGQNDPSGTYIDDISLIYLGAGALSPLLPASAPTNVKSVAAAIDQFVAAGGTLPTGFNNLSSLSGQSLVDALQQLTGEAGSSGGVQAANQLTNSFLTMLLNGFTGGRGGVGGFGAAAGYAPAPVLSAEAANAYAAINKAAPRRFGDSGWTGWGSAYGGQANARGDATVGTNDTRTTAWGLAAGFDRRVSPSTVVGLAFGGGSTNWTLANGLGRGRGEVFQAGAYASHQVGAAYVSAAASYALHSMTTDRTVFVAGTDSLTADFTAHNVGGRIETGWRFLAPGGAVGVTPYAALQVQAFFLPGYTETAASGSGQFALAFDRRTTTTTRSELGAWFDTRQMTGNGPVNLFSRLAWAHDWRSDDSVTAAFQSLGGSSFIVNGAAPPGDVGLVTAGIEAKATKAITVTAKFDGEFADGYQSYAGTGTVKFTW
ncbi:MAG: autotransporter outer membrane beta-barrel domain-containing protein [Xanthobacteraceae bacterium]|nr:autotransporter outer membrane beta-barrel domain-containing protein [Xanthobacteraceae bacterium]